jgi:hypothetical protein
MFVQIVILSQILKQCLHLGVVFSALDRKRYQLYFQLHLFICGQLFQCASIIDIQFSVLIKFNTYIIVDHFIKLFSLRHS